MPNESVLVDTGALAAIFDPQDQFHERCVAESKRLPVGKAFTCWPVITEALYLLRKVPLKRNELLRALIEEEFILLPLYRNALPKIDEVFAKYHDQDVDLADAALVYLADREDINLIFTTDRRHFSVYRKKNGKPFRLLPELD